MIARGSAGRTRRGAVLPATAAVLLLAGLVVWALVDRDRTRSGQPPPAAETAVGSEQPRDATGDRSARSASGNTPSANAEVVSDAAARRDLARDEARGGHTLARHVALSDDDLARRLTREPGIAAASTFADRETAERVVAAALAAGSTRIARWRDGEGRRANLVVTYRGPDEAPVGRILRRGARRAREVHGARVVLRWDERRSDFYVLTAYPEDRP